MSKYSQLDSVQLLATLPHPCGYLPDREATTVFIDPQTPVDQRLYSQLSALGFRRSGNYLYRPQCANCNACVPARVPVSLFVPDRSQRRCWKRNRDLDVFHVDAIDTDEHYVLYARYIEERHREGEMYPPSREQFRDFLAPAWGSTRYIEFRARGRLVATAVTDLLTSGLSAIYTFFDPAEHRRSLGSYCILYQIEWARRLGLPSLYLGYWIEECQKMAYKTQFQPVELLGQNRWRLKSR
ncbi:arginyltransferase [Microbulbifer yueqingensis]|uniref:Aspartate/glutamate leucyltransferase n=1 Tax=Microbulbifer yueqingensis TaxID=658219 RepID=A0A1G8ZSC7_9GAMM|nr:arginyltransferase [Microbulbifer yueqingensis]SDK17245.1 arginine-tRNA-protein transferase [Microbulbifer yueqingensis]